MNREEESDKIEEVEAAIPLGFSNLGLDPKIIKALEKMQFKEPSPIQAQAIPLILEGRDLLALSQTGSGKTAACAIPVCQRVNIEKPIIQALIIVPTRELALQYATEAQKIGLYKGVKAFAIFGGEDASLQQSKLKHGVHILIATPGRLIDFIYSRQIDLSYVETLILDEADEMLSMGFYDDLDFIINCLVHTHQTLLFSATMSSNIRKLAKQHMKDPEEIVLTVNQTSPESLEHRFLYCRYDQRDDALVSQIKELQPVQSIIFCHSRFQVEKVYQFLRKHVSDVDFLHAGLGQDIRTIVTSKFRTGKIRHLVATDVVARGLDFSRVSHVFIYQLPEDIDLYIHRSGRTGRYNKTGVVLSLITNREMPILKSVLKRIQREPIWVGSPPPQQQESHKQQKSKPPFRPRRRPPKNPSN